MSEIKHHCPEWHQRCGQQGCEARIAENGRSGEPCGTGDDTQEFDSYTGGANEKKFILHYNFPPFSVGETGRFGGQNRREIGHGALAERSIEPVIPPESKFPYAMRVSSEVMESNGSTSMGSVCASTMSLLNAGVPLRATFIIDPENVIQHITVNGLNVGRNPAETLRILDALQTDELCPCNWTEGQDTLKPAA